MRRNRLTFLWLSCFLGVQTAHSTPRRDSHQPSELAFAIGDHAPVKGVMLGIGEDYFATRQFHRTIIENLSPDLDLFYFYTRGYAPTGLMKTYEKEIKKGRFHFVEIPQSGDWIRDFAPRFVRRPDGSYALFTYHYWEGTSRPELAVAEWFGKYFGIPVHDSPLRLQGGNLIVDDQNRLYLSKKAIKENPGFTREEIIAELKLGLNVKEVNFLPGLPEEGTQHVDMFMKYLGGNEVVLATAKNPRRKKTLEAVASFLKEKGLNITFLPFGESSEILQQYAMNHVKPAYTYENVLILNKQVFVPQYLRIDSKLRAADGKAVKLYDRLGYKTVPVDAASIFAWCGSIHCQSAEVPLCTGLLHAAEH